MALADHMSGRIPKNVAWSQPPESAKPAYDPNQRPRYVSPEEWQAVVDQNTKNQIGLGVMKRAPGVGSVLSIFDTGKKLFTGKSLADSSMDMKRTYLQASPSERLAMREKYPDMMRFAKSIGDVPGGSSVASNSGTPVRSGGSGSPSTGQITNAGDLVAAATGGTKPSGGDTAQVASTSRPYDYYEWDLGINIPSPGDAKYNEFQGYLAERAAAQAAMYG